MSNTFSNKQVTLTSQKGKDKCYLFNKVFHILFHYDQKMVLLKNFHYKLTISELRKLKVQLFTPY